MTAPRDEGRAPGPARYPDTHTHLDIIEREAHVTPRETVAEARAKGVDFIVDIGMGPDGARTVVERASTLGVYASAGLHPTELDAYPGRWNEIEELAQRPAVVAVGETGLDYYWDREDRGKQREVFEAHIDLAKRINRTLVIHCRDAFDDVMGVLEASGAPPRTIMHCFSGDVVNANWCADRRIWCSFAGNVSYSRNEGLRDAARALPANLILVETDAPFLSPHPYRGKPNSPARIPVIAASVAAARGADPAQFAAVLSANARRAFGIDPADGVAERGA